MLPIKCGRTAGKLPLNEQEQQVYRFTLENGAVTTTQAMELLGVKQRRARDILVKMLELLKWQRYERASLAVQKENYAVKMYKDAGFKIVDENAEEYIMICEL